MEEKSKKLDKLLSIGALIVVLVAFAVISRNLSKTFIINGVKMQDISLGGMLYDDGVLALDNFYNSFLNKKIKIHFEDKIYQTTAKNLGVNFDTYRTIEKVYEISYGDNILKHLSKRFSGVFKPIEIEPVFAIDQEQLEKEISNLIPEISKPHDANIIVDKNFNVKVVADKKGLQADFNDLFNQLKTSVIDFEVPELDIEVEELHASYTEEEASSDAVILKSVLDKEIIFNYNGEKAPIFEYKTKIDPNFILVKNKKIIFKDEEIEKYIQEVLAPKIKIASSDLIIVEVPNENLNYLKTEGEIKNGLKLKTENLVEKIKNAIVKEEANINLDLEIVEGKIVNKTSVDLGNLELLSRGKSNFKGSPYGRSFNINKGLNEKIDNLILWPNKEYSFNQIIGSVTNASGWQDALAIFGNGNLVPVPGGGLCQVATTLFRAVLNSGLRLTERSNHSLYVHYYKAYGDGLDATVYPGIKDLKFINDTKYPILVQAFSVGDDAYIEFYGTKDNRSVELIGPITAKSVPENYHGNVKAKWNQIIWLQKIIGADGIIQENKLVSTYKTAPR